MYVRPESVSKKIYITAKDMHFERVETFCYLGGMLSSDGGYEHAVLVRVNNKAQNNFR